MLWLKEEKLDDVREALRFQKLEKFVRMSENVYPDLVKVFLTNMRSDEEAIYSQVKGIDICINDDVWLEVAGLRNAGVPIGKNNIVGLEMFNKAQFFKITSKFFPAITHRLVSTSSCEKLLKVEALSSHVMYGFLPFQALWSFFSFVFFLGDKARAIHLHVPLLTTSKTSKFS